VPLRIVRGLVKLLRLEDVRKEGGGGKIKNNTTATNDLERQAKQSDHQTIDFFFCWVWAILKSCSQDLEGEPMICSPSTYTAIVLDTRCGFL
jgi:hypothetical protein